MYSINPTLNIGLPKKLDARIKEYARLSGISYNNAVCYLLSKQIVLYKTNNKMFWSRIKSYKAKKNVQNESDSFYVRHCIRLSQSIDRCIQRIFISNIKKPCIGGNKNRLVMKMLRSEILLLFYSEDSCSLNKIKVAKQKCEISVPDVALEKMKELSDVMNIPYGKIIDIAINDFICNSYVDLKSI